jgi:PAS domain S-box-containing protein
MIMTENKTKSVNEISEKPHRKIVTASKDLIIISVAFIFVSVLVYVFGVFEAFQEWARRQPQWTEWHIHDYLFVLVILSLALGIFARRQWIELRREIAERKRIEVEVRLLAQAVASAKDCISITDLNNNILFVNDAFLDMYGYGREELLGKNISVVRSPKVPPELDQEMSAASLTKGWHSEVLNRRRDGSDFPVELWTSIVRDDSGEPVALAGVARDFTERKHAQDLLQKSEALYRTLAEAAHDAIFVINKEGYYEYINNFAAEQVGRRPEEIIGKRREDIFPPYVVDRIARQEAEIFTTGKSAHFEDEIFVSGHTAWFSTWIIPLENKLGEINAIMGVARDITERKRMYETLKKSEMQLSVAQEVANLGSWDVDLVSNTVSWSPQLYRMLDIDPQERAASLEAFIGSIHPEDREKVKHVIEQALRDGKSFEFEHRRIRRDGVLRYLWAKGFISQDESGRATRVFGVEHDITERKRAGEALQESEERFRSVAQSAIDAIIVADGKGNIISWNNAAQTIFGYGEDEALGKPLTLLMPERFHDSHRRGLDRSLSTGKSYTIGKTVEFVGRNKDGIEFPLELSLASWKTGEEVFFTGIIRDVTERKQAGEALRESEERFTAFMNNSPIIAWLKDPATWTYRYVNNAFEEVFNTTREVISTKTDFDLWPEEVARQLRENDLRVMSSDKTIQTSEDVPLPNGAVHHWLVFKFPLHTPSGKPFLAGTAVDITERRRMEEEREKMVLELQDALAEVKTLSGLIPICASCKKIRNDKGYWNQIEGYIMEHSDATFSHGICPDCAQKLYPDYLKK